MVITKIERQKKNPKRVNIFCDDEFVIGLHQDVLLKAGLRKGDTIDEKKLEELQSAEEFSLAKDKALRFISYRQRSEKEVRSRLIEREFHPSVIDRVVSYLREVMLLNDRAFAEAYVHDVLMRKPAGATLIRRQLQLKGVDKDIIDRVVEDKLGSETQSMLAREAAKKYMRRYRPATGGTRKKQERYPKGRITRRVVNKQQKRLSDFLARRGFAWDTVSSVVKEFFPQESEA